MVDRNCWDADKGQWDCRQHSWSNDEEGGSRDGMVYDNGVEAMERDGDGVEGVLSGAKADTAKVNKEALKEAQKLGTGLGG